jgi:hypothetical protein
LKAIRSIKMMFLSLAVALSVASCQSNTANSGVRSFPPDSLAYDSVFFGMTKRAYFEKITDRVTLVNNSLYSFAPAFTPKDEKLYMLLMTSEEYPKDRIATQLMEDMDHLVEKLSTDYGAPTKYYAQPLPHKFAPGVVQWKCEWNLPKKEIMVGLVQIDSDTKYNAICRITDKYLKSVADSQLIDNSRSANK